MQSHGPSGTDQSRSSAFSRSRATQTRNTKTDNIKLQLHYRMFKQENGSLFRRVLPQLNPSSDHIERSVVCAMDCLLFLLLLLSRRSVQRIPHGTSAIADKERSCWRSVHFVLVAPNIAVPVTDPIVDRACRFIQNGWAKRHVYRRRETSLQPRYRATVAQRVSRSGVGINSDSRLSVDDELLLRPLDKPGPITGSADFSISDCNNKQKHRSFNIAVS